MDGAAWCGREKLSKKQTPPINYFLIFEKNEPIYLLLHVEWELCYQEQLPINCFSLRESFREDLNSYVLKSLHAAPRVYCEHTEPQASCKELNLCHSTMDPILPVMVTSSYIMLNWSELLWLVAILVLFPSKIPAERSIWVCYGFLHPTL